MSSVDEVEKGTPIPSTPASSLYMTPSTYSSTHHLHPTNTSTSRPYPSPIHEDEIDLELDIAPVDQPPSIQAIQDREPFQVLARHYSGLSQRSAGGHTISEDPPDGGFTAWSVIMGAWFVLFVQFGIITSFGQLETYYTAHQLAGLPKSQVSWIGSLSVFATFFGSIFSGRFFDTHGAKVMVVTGTTLSTAALFLLAFCKEFYQFLLCHFVFGVAGALLYSPCTAVVAHWFLKRRATAVGIVICGSGLGGVIFPITLMHLFPKLGYRNTILVLAGMAGALYLPSWFTIRARLPPKQNLPWKHAGKCWGETKYAVYCIGVALIWMNYFTPFFYANDFATKNGLPASLAIYSVTFLQAGSFIGRGISGPLAERFGAIETFIFNGIASGVILLALWSSPAVGTVGTIFGLVLYGIFSGVVIALVAACCAQISPVREFGLRLGMLWSTAAIPLLAGPQITGVLIEKENGYTGMAVFCGCTLIAGSALAFAPVMWKRWRMRRGGVRAGKEDVEQSGVAVDGAEGEQK